VVAQAGVDSALAIQRALLTDVIPEHHLAEANAFMALNSGLGRFLAYGLGALDLTQYRGWSEALGSNCRAVFSVALLVLAAGTASTVGSVSEQPYIAKVRSANQPGAQAQAPRGHYC
jgi:hypothetical protein